jgi:CPA1 family monovalent cation:H+ antiporter
LHQPIRFALRQQRTQECSLGLQLFRCDGLSVDIQGGANVAVAQKFLRQFWVVVVGHQMRSQGSAKGVTTIVAYGSYLLANHLHLSGVIATASAGLMVGNFGAKKGMSARTRTALESFWEYLAFVMNSLVCLLIGLEVHINALAHAWRPILFALAAVMTGRSLSVYFLVPVSNLFAEAIPFRWQHVIVLGGLRGALALALALSLDNTFPYRDRVLDLTFGVVVFSILAQGLTMKPLLRVLGLADRYLEYR